MYIQSELKRLKVQREVSEQKFQNLTRDYHRAVDERVKAKTLARDALEEFMCRIDKEHALSAKEIASNLGEVVSSNEVAGLGQAGQRKAKGIIKNTVAPYMRAIKQQTAGYTIACDENGNILSNAIPIKHISTGWKYYTE